MEPTISLDAQALKALIKESVRSADKFLKKLDSNGEKAVIAKLAF